MKTVVFAEDATAFVVHKDLPIDEIDVETLAKILSGEIRNWSELANVYYPINIYGRQSSSGTHSFIKKKLTIEFSNAAKEMTGNAQIIEGVKADKTGIGYVGAGYVAHDPLATQGIKVLEIMEKKGEKAVSPLDEPCSALDPVSTLKIEELIVYLKKKYTIVIVTHNMQQAQRIADKTVFLYLGEIKEEGLTKKIFESPENEMTANYIHGHFG